MSAYPPPPGYPPGRPAGPTSPYPDSRRRRISWPLILTALVAILALVVVAVLLFVIRKDRGEGEVLLQTATSPGPFPWTPSVVPPDAPTSVPPPPPDASPVPPAAPTAAGEGGALTPRAGDQVGLYGGSLDLTVCDKEKQISFLEQNPDKRAAFAKVLGISDVRGYIQSLTQVILTADTRVTNHGFENGRATAFQAVLQAGTAVLIDDRGVPRIRCACGNPLLPPQLANSKPKYTGDPWPRFNPGKIIVIQPTPTPITRLTVINITTGAPITINITVTQGQQEPPTTTGPQQCSPQDDRQINITIGDITCSNAYAIADRYDLQGEKSQQIDSFTCSAGNAMTRPVIFTCVSAQAEFAVSEATSTSPTTPSIDLSLIDGSYVVDAPGPGVDCFNDLLDVLNVQHTGANLAIDFMNRYGKLSGTVNSDGSFTATGRYEVGGGVGLKMAGAFVVESGQYVIRGNFDAFGPSKCSREITGTKR